MYKAAAIGSRESVSGFASLGISVFFKTQPDEVSRLINRLAQNGFAVIFITEAAAAGVSEAIEKFRSRRIPAIILIPGVSGNTGEGMRDLHRSVEKAVGSDILK